MPFNPNQFLSEESQNQAPQAPSQAFNPRQFVDEGPQTSPAELAALTSLKPEQQKKLFSINPRQGGLSEIADVMIHGIHPDAIEPTTAAQVMMPGPNVFGLKGAKSLMDVAKTIGLTSATIYGAKKLFGGH